MFLCVGVQFCSLTLKSLELNYGPVTSGEWNVSISHVIIEHEHRNRPIINTIRGARLYIEQHMCVFVCWMTVRDEIYDGYGLIIIKIAFCYLKVQWLCFSNDIWSYVDKYHCITRLPYSCTVVFTTSRLLKEILQQFMPIILLAKLLKFSMVFKVCFLVFFHCRCVFDSIR